MIVNLGYAAKSSERCAIPQLPTEATTQWVLGIRASLRRAFRSSSIKDPSVLLYVSIRTNHCCQCVTHLFKKIEVSRFIFCERRLWICVACWGATTRREEHHDKHEQHQGWQEPEGGQSLELWNRFRQFYIHLQRLIWAYE